MAKEHIIFISSVWEWGPGDGSIVQGIYHLIPEIDKYDIYFSSYFLDNYDKSKNDSVKYEELVRTAKYVIVPGTPSWVDEVHRITWGLCIKHKKRLAFLGIGLTVPYDGSFWYGKEAFTRLASTGLIDLVVCRDRYCHYWLRSTTMPSDRIATLPCPAFYTFPVREVTEKKNIVYSIANIEYIAVAKPDTTLLGYYNKSIHIVRELRSRGANVSIAINNMIDDNHPFVKKFNTELFPGEKLHRFWGYDTKGKVVLSNTKGSPGAQAYIDFHNDKHVYIGVRNHGALPCAGAGIPSLLLGTDYRQNLAAEIPFLSKLDISYTEWKAHFVLDWYYSLEPASISKSLIKWREITYNRWRQELGAKGVLEALK